ncbi:DUF1285 domain-containing protein [Alphaproteobacteria bacterium]|nr:DUF1285 domain-containing protein [Alphaproteobacteria bacterium]
MTQKTDTEMQTKSGGSAQARPEPAELEYHMHIKADGRWFHEGSPIDRIQLVALFASVLSCDEDGVYWLRTPFEYGKITVEDAPFVITAVEAHINAEHDQLMLTDNLGRTHMISREVPLVMKTGSAGDERPYIMLEKGLSALVSRPVFYELVEMSVAGPKGAGQGIWSSGQFFALEVSGAKTS